MKEARSIRVLIADHDPCTLDGLFAILGKHQDLQVVGQTSSLTDVIMLYRTLQPDVLLIDLRLPKWGGIAVVKAIVAEYSAAYIIVWTALEDHCSHEAKAERKREVQGSVALLPSPSTPTSYPSNWKMPGLLIARHKIRNKGALFSGCKRTLFAPRSCHGVQF